MDFVGLIKKYSHGLKMYIYDIYRFIDAKIMVEKLEKDIRDDIESVKEELEDFTRTRSRTMDNVNEATTPTQLEEKLTEFEVTLQSDVGDEIEEIRNSMRTLDQRKTKSDPPKYHEDVVEQLNHAVESLQNDLERNIHILNSVIQRLDKQANPQEMAKQVKEFKSGQESQELRNVQTHLDDAHQIFLDNSLQRLGGWQKMFSTSVYRKESTNSSQSDFGQNQENDFENEESDFSLDDGGSNDNEFSNSDDSFSDTENNFDSGFDDDF